MNINLYLYTVHWKTFWVGGIPGQMRQSVKSTLKTGILETLVNGSPISTIYFSKTLYELLKPTLDLYLE